jgi:hypothetical protein
VPVLATRSCAHPATAIDRQRMSAKELNDRIREIRAPGGKAPSPINAKYG